ncbi:MAG: hypothetical protein HKN10_11125 [Myxococcales bacterium]|nr:hypothetical protein [Myxococcales bacterium]
MGTVSQASAQDDARAGVEPSSPESGPEEKAPAGDPPTDKRTTYYKRVQGLDDAAGDGFMLTAGLGFRVPIIRWISFAATFDWSLVGLWLRGNPPTGDPPSFWVIGQQVGGTFALTFHFFGVRKN